MRIGIYNRYWNTRGGGEKHAGGIAEVLSRTHRVDLIGVEPVNLAELATCLNLDLSRVEYCAWPPLSCHDLGFLTQPYDLFINATHYSNLISQAEKSIYLVFFPQRLNHPLWSAMSRPLFRLRDLAAPRISVLAGCYEPEQAGIRWTGRQAWLRLKPAAFIDGVAQIPLASDPQGRIVAVNGCDLRWHAGPRRLVIELGGQPAAAVDICIHSDTFIPRDRQLGNDTRPLGVCLDLAAEQRYRLARWSARLANRLFRYQRAFIDSYDLFLANSQYTQYWLKQRWGVESRVLHPPIEAQRFHPPAGNGKQPVILSVGRFFAGDHNKKHLELIRVFRGMVDRGQIPQGWEYHLAGHVHRENPAHVEYFNAVRRLAEGYPIKILTDLPFERLVAEYHAASLFWHAAGWGESDRRHPERFEHFGITTCEAMSAECIPVVIRKAGQLEIVQEGVSGYTFAGEAELVRKTVELIESHGSARHAALGRAARQAVLKFDKAAFAARVQALIEHASA